MSDLGRAIAKMISCKLLIPEDQVCCQTAHMEFVVDKGERTGTISFQLLQFFSDGSGRWPIRNCSSTGTQRHPTTRIIACDICNSHGSDHEVYCLLGLEMTMFSG